MSIHTHIQRTVMLVRKASFGIIQLIAGHSQVEHNPVHSRDIQIIKHLAQIAKITLYRRKSTRCILHSLCRRPNSIFILIKTYDQTVLYEQIRQGTAVTAAPQGAVHINSCRISQNGMNRFFS